MKQLITSLLLIVSLLSFAQAPDAINYQAVIRDVSGTVVTNQNIGVRFSVRRGTATGTVVYQETYTTTTNNFGSIALAIGVGTTVSGNFATVEWEDGTYFLEVEVDVTGGNNYVSLSTMQFLSVPYALHASSTGSNCLGWVNPADFTFVSDSLYAASNSYSAIYRMSPQLWGQLASGTVSVKTSVNGIVKSLSTISGINSTSLDIGGGAVVSVGDLVEITWYMQTETCLLKYVHVKQL